VRTPAPGLLIGDKLRLEHELGRGGMGVVWIAQHLSLHCQVAVKLLPEAAVDAESQTRFAREARAAAQVDHPHVVRIFDYGVGPDGQPYIIMELLRGESLERRLGRAGPLPIDETRAIVQQAAMGLERAHALGVVHRDLKPGNLFLVEAGGPTFVKLLDFGIARYRVDGLALTHTTNLLGTPGYMSPEQILQPRSVDHRADLWALAVVAYECLTGALPFQGETVGAISVAVCNGRHSPATRRRPGLDREVDRFFERAFQLVPEARFGSAAELATAFDAAARGAAAHGAAPTAHVPSPPDVLAPSAPATATGAVYGPPMPQQYAGMPAPTPAVWAGTHAPATPRRSPWPFVVVALAVVAGLTAVFIVRALVKHEGRATRDAPTSEPASAAPGPAETSPAASDEPAPARPATAARSTPTATASVAAPSSRNRSLAVGIVLGCWRDNEGSIAGQRASHATVQISVPGASQIIIPGPHPHFKACCVSRLSAQRWDPEPSGHVFVAVDLPAAKAAKGSSFPGN
jgi:serine/threonine-protein kinase